MHLLMLVSDFEEVMHVQRPEDGTVHHAQAEQAPPPKQVTAALARFSWARFAAVFRADRRLRRPDAAQ